MHLCFIIHRNGLTCRYHKHHSLMKVRLFALLMLLSSGIACQHESATTSKESAGSKSGIVYHSPDGGKTWEDISTGLHDSLKPNSLSFHEGELWLGASDGLYRGTRYISETVWEKTPLDARELGGFTEGREGRYVISYWHGIFQELPGTGLWAPMHQHMQDPLVNALTETGTGSLLAGCESGIYRSDNRGKSWTQVCKSIRIISLMQHNGVIIAGSIAGIYRSADDGKTWERTLTGDLEARQIYSVREGIIGLVEQDPPVRGVRERGLYLSADNGLTWRPSGVRPPGAIYSMVVSGNIVYTVTSTGIYSSENLGASWTPVNPATNKEDVFTTLISAGGDLYLFVNNGGGC